uniref:Uncharacterized protein n=1 Tax=Nicotiana tabacum TaxID=4097 RepID=A0A1S3ZDY3_TOBAC|nr:PREDICTED: uncharacterized protein LOC107785712 [Nicotiana tabacum]
MEAYRCKSHNLNRSSGFSSCRSSGLLTRPASPNRVNLRRPVTSSSFSSTSTGGSISVHRREPQQNSGQQNKKRHCMCAPTNHPGSFRCSLHKNSNQPKYGHINTTTLNLNIMRRSAMVNSLVGIGAVEDGELVKRKLIAFIIWPSKSNSYHHNHNHNLKPTHDFQPRSSRLSVMSKARDF